VKAMDVVKEMDHPTVGTFKTLNVPWDFQDTPASLRLPPPLLGQHTREILTEAGLLSHEVEELFRKGLVKETVP